MCDKLICDERTLEYSVWPEDAKDIINTERMIERKWVIYLHGVLASKEDINVMLSEQVCDNDKLANLKKTIGIVSINRPGFGESVCVSNYPKYSDIANDVINIAKQLGLTKLEAGWGIVGYSAGGPVALSVGSCPDILELGLNKIVLIASPCVKSQVSISKLRPFRKILIGIYYLSHAFIRRFPKVITKNYLKLPEFICENRTKSLETYYTQGSWFPTWECLMLEGCTDETNFMISDVKVPVDLFHGVKDKIVNIKNAYQIIDNLKTKTKFIIYDDLTHLSISTKSCEIFSSVIDLNITNESST